MRSKTPIRLTSEMVPISGFAWVKLVARRPVAVLLVLALLTVLLGYSGASRFKMNANLSDLIAQDAPWRAQFDAFETEFPDLVRTAVVVVDSGSQRDLEQVTAAVVNGLRARPDLFAAIAAPGSEPFFRDHALLYMDLDQLDDMADRLARAQPWLTAVAEDPSLRGVLALVEDGIVNEPPDGFARVLDLLADSAQRASAGAAATIAWTDELFELSERRYQLIFLKAARAADGAVRTDAEVVAGLRQLVTELEVPAGTRVRLTGELALQQEELEAAVGGVTLAGWLSLALLLAVMVIGVRSVKIILATFSMLAIGVVWTTGIAMLTVGEYNTLSIVFIVMFFGLGVDFALHYSLRYQEAINRADVGVEQALLTSSTSVGRAIALCTVTTALGFLGFVWTDYQGLADLGVISAWGMLVAFVLTFTYLPAFYAVVGPPRAHDMDIPSSAKVVGGLLNHPRTVLLVVAVAGLGAGLVAGNASFDYSVLALKDPNSESMRTFRELQREGHATDYQLVAMASEPVDKTSVAALAVVDEVRTAADLVPDEQLDKLYVVEELQQLLGSAVEPDSAKAAPDAAALRDAARELTEVLAAASAAGELAAEAAAPAAALAAALRALQAAPDDAWLSWQRGAITNLLDELAWLRRALAVQEITFDDVPPSARQRMVNDAGRQLSVITPAHDIADVDELSAFIQEVRQLVPNATGRPVIEWGVGGIVVQSFQQALIFSALSITAVLLLALRRVRLVLLILLPLGLAALMTLALGVLTDQPINMANILVLPLIFGLGVDNGIHVVDRYLGEGDVEHLMHSSTPRAVMLSALTTIGAFSALSFSAHAGTASIGVLLTVAVGLLLLLTIFILPVLLVGKAARR